MPNDPQEQAGVSSMSNASPSASTPSSTEDISTSSANTAKPTSVMSQVVPVASSSNTLIAVVVAFVVGAGLVLGGQQLYNQYKQQAMSSQKESKQEDVNVSPTESIAKQVTPTATSTPTHTAIPSVTATPTKTFDFSQFKKFTKVNSNTLKYYLTKTVKGQYLSAQLPQGWMLVEYYNGAGTNMLTEGVSYTGLTGVAIKNDKGQVVFTLKAVSGIGGPSTCPKYYKFPDNNDIYMHNKATLSQQNGVTTQVVNVTAGNYTETALLDHVLRRVKNKNIYVADMNLNDSKYESACGIDLHILQFSPIYFKTGGIVKEHSYQLDIQPGISESDLLKLDNVLFSIKAL